MLFADKLRHLRHEAHLDQSEVATQVDLASHSHISHLEAGRKDPSLMLICRLALIFRVTTDYLLLDDISVEAVPIVDHPPGRTYLHVTGPKLQRLRQLHSMSQSDLARKLGLRTHTYVSLVEAQRREPPVQFIVQSARLFNVTTDLLLWDDLLLDEQAE